MAGTSERILDVAESIYRSEGAEGLSMRRVADELGMTATAIYRHYANKDELLDAVANRGFEQLAAAFRRVRNAGVMAVIDAFRSFALKKPALFDLMFFSRRARARQFPRDFTRGESPSGSALVELLTERGVADPLEAALMLWAEAQGLISLHRAGRFESEAAFRRAWDQCFARLMKAL